MTLLLVLLSMLTLILAREGGETTAEDARGSTQSYGDNARQLANITVGTIGESYNVKEHAAINASSVMLPPAWDSTSCMVHWETPELQYELDPNGYVIFVSGREQLGANRVLFTDGLFIAKTLNRTLVEFPVKDSRVTQFEEGATGLGIYWHLDKMCMYHRMLDLRTFRNMVADGTIPPEGKGDGRSFATISTPDFSEHFMRKVRNEDDVLDKFRDFEDVKVIVLEHLWRTQVDREALTYLEPNPHYKGVVQRLLEQTRWGAQLVAVQWRTESSTGDLCQCYQEVKAVVEEHRLRLGYGVDQVFFNIDIFGRTSATYYDRKREGRDEVLDLIREDYPEALDNSLHDYLARIEDTGVQSIVSGLVVASAEVMVGSSLNAPDTTSIPEAAICEKPSSNFVHLVAEWRQALLSKPPNSTITIFAFTFDE